MLGLGLVGLGSGLVRVRVMPRSHQKRNASLCWLCMEARRHFRCERASGSAVRPSTLWLNLLTHVYGDILMRTFYINYRVGLRRYIIRARLPLLSLSLSLCRALCRNHSNGRTLSRRCQLMSVRRTARGRASAERGYSRAAMGRASAEPTARFIHVTKIWTGWGP